jgi:hypothetical protein
MRAPVGAAGAPVGAQRWPVARWNITRLTTVTISAMIGSV